MTVFKFVLICVLMALFFVSVALTQSLRIYHIDVEQGDATFFVFPNGRTMLVDSGPNGKGDQLKAVMDEAGATQIDVYVNTHYHKDHYGSIDDLVNDHNIEVIQAYDRADKGYLPNTKLAEKAFINYQNAVGEDAYHLNRGNTVSIDPSVFVRCISCGGVVIGEDNPVTGTDENDMSISLLLDYGQFKYFVGGDIEENTEAKIAERDLVTNVDVYQSNHHGSATSSSREFMEDLSPSVIIISNGNHGGFKHPRQTTLNLYASLSGPPNIFQTNKYTKGGSGGNVSDAFIADLESQNNDDGTILVTVDNNAGNYTVSYGDNTVHTFQIKGTQTQTEIVIESLLPNPEGNDSDLEEVTLKNTGNNPVNLSGWWLIDLGERIWDLTGEGFIQPQSSLAIQRNGRPMSLNNSGDHISLYDATNTIQDEYEYSSSTEGTIIQTGH